MRQAYGGHQAVCERQAARFAALEKLHPEETLVPGEDCAGKLSLCCWYGRLDTILSRTIVRLT